MSSQEPHSTDHARTSRGGLRDGSDAGHGRPLSTITASDFDDETDAASEEGAGSSAGSIIVAETSPVSVYAVHTPTINIASEAHRAQQVGRLS